MSTHKLAALWLTPVETKAARKEKTTKTTRKKPDGKSAVRRQWLFSGAMVS